MTERPHSDNDDPATRLAATQRAAAERAAAERAASGQGVDPPVPIASVPIAADADAWSRDPWGQWRRQMPVCDRWVYLDHAAVAPLPSVAAAAAAEYARQASEQGDMCWPRWNATLGRLRCQLAELIGAADDEVCLVPNTTTGINWVAEGLDWRRGDNIVVPEGEFPSNLFPWQNQAHRGVEIRQVPRRDGRVEVADLMARVDDSTRLVTVSWVGYASGFRVDLASLTAAVHDAGALLFVDAIQGLGIHELDVRAVPIDFLAADGHKWLLGPEGIGVFYVRRDRLPLLRCAHVGWNGVENAGQFSHAAMTLKPTTARYEAGSANMIGAAALSASVELFLRVRRQSGPDAIGRRVVQLATELSDGLRAAGMISHYPEQAAHRGGIVSFEVPRRDPVEVRERLIDAGIVVSCRGGGVRAAVHVYNTSQELDRVIAQVKRCQE